MSYNLKFHTGNQNLGDHTHSNIVQHSHSVTSCHSGFHLGSLKWQNEFVNSAIQEKGKKKDTEFDPHAVWKGSKNLFEDTPNPCFLSYPLDTTEATLTEISQVTGTCR